MIREIFDPAEKRRIASSVLTALPDWFGLPESTAKYIEDSSVLPFWAAYEGESLLGFAALKLTSPHTAEIYVMGVMPERHRRGTGRGLHNAMELRAQELGCSFMQVKTVEMGRYAEYDRTNRFYIAMGFREFECFPSLWDEWNPCQVYIKYIGK